MKMLFPCKPLENKYFRNSLPFNKPVRVEELNEKNYKFLKNLAETLKMTIEYYGSDNYFEKETYRPSYKKEEKKEGDFSLSETTLRIKVDSGEGFSFFEYEKEDESVVLPQPSVINVEDEKIIEGRKIISLFVPSIILYLYIS